MFRSASVPKSSEKEGETHDYPDVEQAIVDAHTNVTRLMALLGVEVFSEEGLSGRSPE
jgi:hypothetical protein